MAWATLLKYCSEANKKVVTSSRVLLPLYVRRLDNLMEKPQLSDRPGVNSRELRFLCQIGVGLERVAGARVA
jgi:hypothetical protein